MNSRYSFRLTGDVYNPLYQYTTVAYVFDNETNEPVFFVDIIPGCYKRIGKHVCFVGEKEAESPELKGHFFGLAYMSEEYYKTFIVDHIKFGEVMIMHELGHYLNGDHNKITDMSESDDERLQYNLNGQVDPKELKADEFAIRQCGKSAFNSYMDFMIDLRQKRANDPVKELAINEFKLRKEACKKLKL